MSQNDIHAVKGLATYKNELTLPEGSLTKAKNVVINRDDIIESRRGFKVFNGDIPDGETSKQLLQYKDRLLVHYLDDLAFDNGNGEFIAFNGDFPEMQSGLRIKGLEANGNYFFTTSNGIKKISAKSADDFTSDSGYIRDAGVPKALDVQTDLNTSSGGFLEHASVVAYRVLWGYKDNNDNLILGAPSSDTVIGNRQKETSITNRNIYF